jgi:hypothetical protein
MQFVTIFPDNDVFAQAREQAASLDPVRAACGRMMLELMDYLQSRGPTPQASAIFFRNVLSIGLRTPTRGVRVWVDWQDYGAVRDGLPVMHYRVDVDRPDSKLSENHRANTMVEAACLILTA